MTTGARKWNLRRRKEVGDASVRAVMGYLRGRPLEQLERWCGWVRDQGMSDTTLECLLDACAWRVGRPVPQSVYQPVIGPRQPAMKPRERARKDYWHYKRRLEVPPRDLRKHPHRCTVCRRQIAWDAERCPGCKHDQWNPHLRRWEPNTTKETA